MDLKSVDAKMVLICSMATKAGKQGYLYCKAQGLCRILELRSVQNPYHVLNTTRMLPSPLLLLSGEDFVQRCTPQRGNPAGLGIYSASLE